MRGTDVGTFQIRNDVIGTIAALAAQEVEGVLQVWHGPIPFAFLSRVSPGGVRVETKDQEVRLRISLVVEYGVDLASLASEVQNRVREAVERMTHLAVADVQVKIQQVQAKGKSTR